MCGINGFNFKNKGSLASMNACLTHRGPDFAGTFESEDMSLGHLLLSIRESTSLSEQPYKKNDEWILLFNGQIYNTKQLEQVLDTVNPELKDLDTYILYRVIEKYGWNFIEKIQGMFSIALYNTIEGELRLYRDKSGQKPLYYYFKNETFIFSSEIKGILSHAIDKDIDESAVSIATALGYIPGNKTLFRYIQKLNPGECITYNQKTKKISSASFSSKDDNYFSEDVSKAFEELVSEHLQSKQKVAINLSGGLDSSLLLHEMTKVGHKVDSYTTIFENCNENYNKDALLSRQLAKDYNTNHHEISITKESYLKHFVDSYKILEEPDYNISLPIYLETAGREGIHGDKNRVILSGNGGDEIFGGYPYYYQSSVIERQIKLLSPFIFNLIKNKRNNTEYKFQDMDELWLFFKRFRFDASKIQNDENLKKYIKQTSRFVIESSYKKELGAVHSMMLRDRALWMPAENFMQADKIFMSQSIEMRSPLSYYPFRLYCDKILNSEDYIDKEGNKKFLRNLYKGKLPDYIIERKDKTGWRSPINNWYDKTYRSLFLEIISNQKNNTIINWKEVRQRIEKSDTWPGKYVHLYLSLAILSDAYNIDL